MGGWREGDGERWCVYAGELTDKLRREGKKNGKRG